MFYDFLTSRSRPPSSTTTWPTQTSCLGAAGWLIWLMGPRLSWESETHWNKFLGRDIKMQFGDTRGDMQTWCEVSTTIYKKHEEDWTKNRGRVQGSQPGKWIGWCRISWYNNTMEESKRLTGHRVIPLYQVSLLVKLTQYTIQLLLFLIGPTKLDYLTITIWPKRVWVNFAEWLQSETLQKCKNVFMARHDPKTASEVSDNIEVMILTSGCSPLSST